MFWVKIKKIGLLFENVTENPDYRVTEARIMKAVDVMTLTLMLFPVDKCKE